MAERRMFSKALMKSDAFLDMTITAQLLYIQLALEADDDGFMANSNSIMRMCGCSQSDMSELCNKGLIIKFDSGVIAITHWKMQNYIPKDRYRKTQYKNERAQLELDDSGVYYRAETMDTTCIQPVYKPYTQDSISKNSLDKDSLGKSKSGEKRIEDNTPVSCDTADDDVIKSAVDAWNALGLRSLNVLPKGSKREKLLKARINEYGLDNVLKAIDNVRASPFLTGQTKDAFKCTFDWLIDAANFPKVLDGNYAPLKTCEKPAHEPEKPWAHNADLLRMCEQWSIPVNAECGIRNAEL